jgi:hypothetical protein
MSKQQIKSEEILGNNISLSSSEGRGRSPETLKRFCNKRKDKSPILDWKAFTCATIKGTSKHGIEINGTKEQRDRHIVMFKASLQNISKNDLQCPVNAMIDPNEHVSFNETLGAVIDYASMKIDEAKEKTHKEEELLDLIDQLMDVMELKDDPSYMIENAEKLKENTIIAFWIRLCNDTDRIIVNQINERVVCPDIYTILNEFTIRPYLEKNANSVYGAFGITRSASQLFERMEQSIGRVDREMINEQMKKATKVKIPVGDGGQEAIKAVDEITNECAKMEDLVRRYEARGKSVEGLGIKNRFYILLECMKEALEASSEKMGVGIQVELHMLLKTYEEDGDTGTLEVRYSNLKNELQQTFSDEKKFPKCEVREMSLNANTKPQRIRTKKNNEKGKATSNRPIPKGRCVGILRKGYCDKQGCKFMALTKEERNNIGWCRTDEANEGSCTRNPCFFRHKSDVWENKKCVHSKKTSTPVTVQAVEVSKGAAESESDDDNDAVL